VGARVLDTTGLTIEEQVEEVVKTAEQVRSRIAAVRLSAGDDNPMRKQKPLFRIIRLAAWFAAKLVFGLKILRDDAGECAETYIYACNHRSNGDPPIVSGAIDREIAFLAKESLFKVPFLGWLITKLNSIPTARDRFDRKAVRVAFKWLEGGGSLLMFPEGQRSQTLDLGEAKAGVGYLALRSGLSVMPVFLSGSQDLWGAFLRRTPLTIAFGRPIRLTDPEHTSTSSESCHEYGKMVMCAIGALQEDIETAVASKGGK
jgi:1-acyl-sn-glycerol-3-phosphate acyltransferase